jgi:hypothetical protein
MLRPVHLGGGKVLLEGVSDTVTSYSRAESCISQQDVAAPTPSIEKDDIFTNRTTPVVLQLQREGKPLRLKNNPAFVTPATRARSTSKHPTPSITVTPHEREVGKTLANLSSSIKRRKSLVKARSSVGDQIYFPVAVHALLTEAANKYPEIMDWVHDGEAFVVKVTTVSTIFNFSYFFFSVKADGISLSIFSFFFHCVACIHSLRARNWSAF